MSTMVLVISAPPCPCILFIQRFTNKYRYHLVSNSGINSILFILFGQIYYLTHLMSGLILLGVNCPLPQRETQLLSPLRQQNKRIRNTTRARRAKQNARSETPKILVRCLRHDTICCTLLAARQNKKVKIRLINSGLSIYSFSESSMAWNRSHMYFLKFP